MKPLFSATHPDLLTNSLTHTNHFRKRTIDPQNAKRRSRSRLAAAGRSSRLGTAKTNKKTKSSSKQVRAHGTACTWPPPAAAIHWETQTVYHPPLLPEERTRTPTPQTASRSPCSPLLLASSKPDSFRRGPVRSPSLSTSLPLSFPPRR